MLMYLSFRHVTKSIGHFLHIVRVEHVITRMIILSMPSYVLREVGHNEVHISTKVLSNTTIVHFQQIAEAHVVNGAKRCHRFNAFTDCSPTFFVYSRRRRGLNLIYDFFLFRVMGTCTGFWLHQGLCFSVSLVIFTHRPCPSSPA